MRSGLFARGMTKSPTLADYTVYYQRRGREQPETGARPLVSVVTATLNSAEMVARTIQSVQAQQFRSLEHILVDGGSTDGTIGIIRNSARPIDYWITEQDRGISDAFNKGVAMARGRFIQILNADDWLSSDQIALAVAEMIKTSADFVFGDLIFYENGQASFVYTGDADYARVIERRMPAIGHPTLLAARTCFERAGLFNLAYRRAMDYDWLLRLHRAGGRGAYCAAVVGHMTHDGVSNREFRNTIQEVKDIAIAHGRSRFLATAEAHIRQIKTAAAGPLKRHAQPLYRLIRRGLNSSFRPVSSHH